MEEQIINYVRNNELLYNPKNSNYKNFELKLRKWKELAASLDMEVGKVRCRWKSLRDSFIRERNKLKLSPNASHKKWRYFDELSFLNAIPQTPRNRSVKIKIEKPERKTVFSNNTVSLNEPDIYYGETSNCKDYEMEEEDETQVSYVKTDFECIDETDVPGVKDCAQQTPPNHIELFFQSIAAQVENLELSQQQFTSLEIRVLQLLQDYYDC